MYHALGLEWLKFFNWNFASLIAQTLTSNGYFSKGKLTPFGKAWTLQNLQKAMFTALTTVYSTVVWPRCGYSCQESLTVLHWRKPLRRNWMQNGFPFSNSDRISFQPFKLIHMEFHLLDILLLYRPKAWLDLKLKISPGSSYNHPLRNKSLRHYLTPPRWIKV